MPRYDDDEEEPASTRPDRRRDSISHSDASELVKRQGQELRARLEEKIEKFFEEREDRARARQEEDRLRRRREKEILDRIEGLADKVSDLYSKDALDAGDLARIKDDIKNFKVDLLTETSALKKTMTAWEDERKTLLGRIDGFKWAIVGVAGAATFFREFLTWAFSHVH